MGESSSSSTENSPLPLVNGSARLFTVSGGTDILCSVKAELAHPASNAPRGGQITIHVEDNQNTRNEALESILSSLLIVPHEQLELLCIVPKYYVWGINVDLFIVSNSDGSIVDACSHVIQATLASTKLPKVESLPAESGIRPPLQVSSDARHSSSVPIAETPTVVSVTVMKDVDEARNDSARNKRLMALIVDATLEEEACSFAQIHVAIAKSDGEPIIVSLQKTGRGAIQPELMQEIAILATNTRMSVKRVPSQSKESLLGGHFAIHN